jgi:type I restriction enzyme S subunit
MPWSNQRLGDYCEVIAGQSPEGKYYNDKAEGLPFYQGKKEFGDRYIGAPQKWTTKVTKEAKADDILMSVRAPVGPINFSTEHICIGRGLAAIRPSDELDKDFLFYYLLSKQDEIQGSEGAVFASINKSQIQALSFSYVNLEEQKRIVAILDQAFADINKARALTEQNLKNARELFESYLQQVFSQRGEGWSQTTLGELCERMEYGTSAKSKTEGKVPVLRMGNIQDGLLDWKKLVYTDNDDDIVKLILEVGDVLFNRTNSPELVGKSAIYRGESPAIFAGYLIRLQRKKGLLDGEFLNFYLNSRTVREYGFSVMSHSTNQANISGTKLKSYPISLPSLEMQKEIAARASSLKTDITRVENLYREKLAALDELKKSLLQKAFTGELISALPKNKDVA